MKPERQRIAIAEACGWFGPKHPHTLSLMEGWWSQQKGVWWCMPDGKSMVTILDVPDYTNDLNAMHEAVESVLVKAGRAGDWRGWGSYILHLQKRLGEDEAIDATAAQRAEAFLRTLGKWEGD